MKKKTLILTDRFYPEEVFINAMLPEFTNQGICFEILTQAPNYPFGKVNKFPGYKNSFFKTVDWKGVPVRRIFTIEGYRESKFLKILHYISFSVFCSIFLLFKGRKYERIFVFQSGSLLQALPAVLAKKLYHCRVFIWTLDLWPDTVYALAFRRSWWLTWFLDWVVTTVYKNCYGIFVSSPGFVERIRAYVPDKEIHFMPQWSGGMETGNHSEIHLDSRHLHFTFAGNIAKTQNLDMVIRGFNQAFLVNERIRLNIFGDGSNLDELKRMIKTEAIQGVTFCGRYPQSAMSHVFSQSQVLLISLKPDPVFDRYIPLKFSSYLNAMKPIYAILNGEVRNLVETHSIGLTADPSDTHSIAAGFIAFAQMRPEELVSLSRNTIHLSSTIFNKTRILETFFTHFK